MGLVKNGRTKTALLVLRRRHHANRQIEESLKIMIQYLIQEFALVGLTLNSDKCKIQCSVSQRILPKFKVGDVEFPVVSADEGFSLLGTVYTLNGNTKVEVQNRIKIAWGKFHSIWHLPSSRIQPEAKAPAL